MRIALYSNKVKRDFLPVFEQIIHYFNERCISLLMENETRNKLERKYNFSVSNIDSFSKNDIESLKADLLLSIGGDGTFLSSIQFAIANNIPVAGINCGRLGFLADIQSHDIVAALDQFMLDDYSLEKRTLLEVAEPNGLFDGFNVAMNELTVHKLDNSSMIKIETKIDGEYLAGYWADGLIVSTPTGSTAYSLSVGGPIVAPGFGGIVITPIASHNLTVRPIVVPDNVEIELNIEGRGNQFLVSSDHRSEPLDFSHKIVIRKSEKYVSVVKLNGQSFYSTLRNKLMWGADRRN